MSAKEAEKGVDPNAWRETEQETEESTESEGKQGEDEEADAQAVEEDLELLVPGDFQSAESFSFPTSFSSTPFESPYRRTDLDLPDGAFSKTNPFRRYQTSHADAAIQTSQKQTTPLPVPFPITAHAIPLPIPPPPTPSSALIMTTALPSLTFSGNPNIDDPRHFWHKFHQACVLARIPKTERCELFEATLELDSPAYVWYQALPSATGNDYDQLKKAFETKYNTTKKPDAMPDDDALEYLEKTFPLGTEGLLEYDNKPDEPARRRYRTWGRNVAAAAIKQHISDRVVGMLRKKLPKVMQEVLAKASSWEQFATAIEGADEERIRTRLDDTARLERLEEELQEMKKIRTRSNADYDLEALVRKLGSITIAPQSASSRVASSAPTHTVTQPPPPTARAPSGPAPTGAASRTPGYASWPDRLVALKKNARDPHPGTPAGRAAYHTDLKEWEKRHGTSGQPDETKPYPLTPGTRPVGSGECFTCGQDWHGTANGCGVDPIPAAENSWRRTANTILKNNGVNTTEISRAHRQAARTAPNVNIVQAADDWQPGSSSTIFSQYSNPWQYGGDAHEQAWTPYASSSTYANAESGEGKV